MREGSRRRKFEIHFICGLLLLFTFIPKMSGSFFAVHQRLDELEGLFFTNTSNTSAEIGS